MTMLASWIGIDTHGITSAYLLADSRFSWRLGSRYKHFDYGKKVFSSKKYPEIMGYSGDVLFPTVVISQIIEMIDSGLLFEVTTDCDTKKELIINILRHELEQYPEECISNLIQIIYITRDTIFCGYPNFYVYLFTWHKNGEWEINKIELPEKSGLICILGSGNQEFIKNYAKYKNGNNSDTSQSVYHCFVDTLDLISDPFCGGAPQMVGIYRMPNSFGRNFGILYRNKKYVLGLEMKNKIDYNNIEWRNELFELIDGNTHLRLAGAQRQPNVDKHK